MFSEELLTCEDVHDYSAANDFNFQAHAYSQMGINVDIHCVDMWLIRNLVAVQAV